MVTPREKEDLKLLLEFDEGLECLNVFSKDQRPKRVVLEALVRMVAEDEVGCKRKIERTRRKWSRM